MRIELKLTAFVLLTFSAFPIVAHSAIQEPDKKKCPSEVKYDRFEDETREFCGDLVTETIQEGIEAEIFGINGLATYSGNSRRSPITIELNVINVQMKSGVAKPKFVTAKEMFLLTDSKRMVLPLVRSSPPTIEAQLTSEVFQVRLNRPIVEALMAAKSVEGRLGSKEFRFDDGELRQFQAFLRELLPYLPRTPARRK